MKFITGLLTAAAAAMCLHAAPGDARIFRNTIRHVDMDGQELLFFNTTGLLSRLNNLPGLVKKCALAIQTPPARADIAAAGTAIAVKTLNFQALQGLASSTKELPGNIWLSKHYSYLGNNLNLPGIFDCRNITNKYTIADELSKLPSDLIFAVKIQLNTQNFYEELSKNIQNSGNAVIQSGFSMLNAMAAQSGSDLKALTTAINGEIFIIIAGSSEKDIRMSLTICDNNGQLSAMLKKFLPPAPGTPDRSIIPPDGAPEFLRPAIFYQGNQVVLVSNVNRPMANGKKFTAPRKFAACIPAAGAGFCAFQLTPELIATLRSFKAGLPLPLQSTLNALKPACAIECRQIERDGIKSTVISDFSYEQIVFEYNKAIASMR